MKDRYLKVIALTVIVVFSVSLLPLCLAQTATQDNTSSFILLNHPEGDLTYELNVTIPQTLYQYYAMQSHAVYSQRDLAQFITPYTLKPIADKLWQIYNNTEDFTNGVLMLVHQITYKEVIPGEYPVETLFNGYGDCDLFAYIAASILEAGGIPTVLIYYKEQLHMEIGVDLGSVPTEARVETFSINYRNTSYYIGECTGSQWRDGWRIGETPIKYQNVSSQVVPLASTEQSSIGQISVTLRQLDHSTVAIQLSQSITLENNSVTVSGQILPKTAYENVTLKAKINSNSWTTIGMVETQEDGRFSYSWFPSTCGILVVQASWIGNRQSNGATSSQSTVVVLPVTMVLLIIALVLVVGVFAVVFVKVLRKKPTTSAQPSKTLPFANNLV
jgi:hypothetical protein